MSQIDSQKTPEQQNSSVQSSAEVLSIAKQNRLVVISKLSNPRLQKLAQTELNELETLEAEMSWEKLLTQQAHTEFKSDIDALILLQEKYWDLDGFDQFANFLTSWLLSPSELETFYDILNIQWLEDNGKELSLEFKYEGFPTTRESYEIFADKFGIKTSSNLNEKFDGQSKKLFLNAVTSLQSLSSVPEVTHLAALLGELEGLEWAAAQNQMRAISIYLVWTDGQSGNLDTILTALKEQDAKNAANGNPTKHFEAFTRTVRDFSPEVSRRIDAFVSEFDTEDTDIGQSTFSHKQALIAGAIPNSAQVDTDNNGDLSATLWDGTGIRLQIAGDQITRSMHLEGSDVLVETPLLPADYSDALGEYEIVKQDLAPKKARCKQAITFLQNPSFADVPLAKMQEGLRKVLGYTLYEKLGISSVTDRQQLISTLNTNITDYSEKLTRAEDQLNKAQKQAIARSQERYREQDEKIKTTLRAVKNSGLGLLDISFLTTQIKSGLAKVDIGVPVEIQNFDLANSNFWEPQSVTNNPTKHIEYIYRMANKILTGNPEGMVNGKLVWFSLKLAISTPNSAQKTDSELKSLLVESGMWNETTGVNKEKMLAQLAKPVAPVLG